MKKFVVMAISVFLVCGVGNIAKADLVTTNLLANPGFEIYTGPPTVDFANWTEGGAIGRNINPPSSDVVHSGVGSAYFGQTGGSLYQTFDLPASVDTLAYGAYIRVQTFGLVSNWDRVQISMQVTGDGSEVLGGSVSDLSLILGDPTLWTNRGGGNYWTPWILLYGTIDTSAIGATNAGINIYLQDFSTGIRTNLFVDDAFATPVPEPGTMMLLGSGLVGLVGYGRRRFKK